MGKISKYTIDRLEERNIELRFDCPYCGGTRIGLKYKNQEDFWNGVVCHKCKSRVILDSLNLTVLKAAQASAVKQSNIKDGVNPETVPVP